MADQPIGNSKKPVIQHHPGAYRPVPESPSPSTERMNRGDWLNGFFLGLFFSAAFGLFEVVRGTAAVATVLLVTTCIGAYAMFLRRIADQERQKAEQERRRADSAENEKQGLQERLDTAEDEIRHLEDQV